MSRWRARRLAGNPIVHPGLDARMGTSIQGPSLIRVPDWIEAPLGRYYLYFADHKGDYIRLAYADALEGPWTVHRPGSLQLARSGFPTVAPPVPPDADQIRVNLPGIAPDGTPGIPSHLIDATCPHIASPDVHVDTERRRIVMYYHGLVSYRVQRSRVVTSADGIDFGAPSDIVGPAYFRVFRHGGFTYAMTMPGIFHRSADGFADFKTGPRLFAPDQRHSALLKRGDSLHVFWTRVGEAPERIYCSQIDISGAWDEWRAGEASEVLRPEFDWEGANEPLEPSWRSAVSVPVNQLRDPAIFEEDGRTFLLYAGAGESNIGIAELGLEG